MTDNPLANLVLALDEALLTTDRGSIEVMLAHRGFPQAIPAHKLRFAVAQTSRLSKMLDDTVGTAAWTRNDVIRIIAEQLAAFINDNPHLYGWNQGSARKFIDNDPELVETITQGLEQ